MTRCTTREQALGLLATLMADPSPFIAIDTETLPFDKKKGLVKAWQLPLQLVGFYTPNTQGYITADVIPKEEFQALLNSKNFAAHNWRFDATVLGELYDVESVKFLDTMILAWLTDENRGSNGLKQLAVSVLGVKENEVVKFDEIPMPELGGTLFSGWQDEAMRDWRFKIGEYCVRDCRWTYELACRLWPMLTPAQAKFFREVEMPIVTALRKMERRGIEIDMERLAELRLRLEYEVAKAHADLTAVASDVNFDSPVQLRELLFEKMGFKPLSKTESGLASTDADTLEELLRRNPDNGFLKSLLRYRECQKILGTYAVGLGELAINGTIHTSFNQLGAATGRFSSSSPNVQNMPTSKEFNVRSLFRPRAGHTFIVADFSQIELRVLAHFTQAKTLLEAYARGEDIHQATADKIGCTRAVAKSINFGLNYGRTAHGMSKAIGISKQECQTFIDKYFRELPEVKARMDQLPQLLLRDGYVETIVGRHRRFPEYRKYVASGSDSLMGRIERIAVNASIQGGASDIVKTAMKDLDKGLKDFDAHMLMQIHDEIVLEVPREKAEACAKYVQHAMENCYRLDNVPMAVTMHVGDSWEH